MSRRTILPAAGLVAGALALAPSGAMAAQKQITINTTPNPVVNGDPVSIYGQLAGAKNIANRPVTLWHKIAGQPRFTPVAHTTTNSSGFYIIPRAEGVVRTNRKWFVRAARVRSNVVKERVYAEVKLNQPTENTLTRRLVAFTGTVTPGNVHRGDRVFLQRSVGQNGDKWHTIDRSRVRADGSYVIGHRFGQPGSRTLRVLLRRDRFNITSSSSPVSVNIQQAQHKKFTILTAANPINAGATTSISGQLSGPGSAGRTVTLFYRAANMRGLTPGPSTSTDSSGKYTFNVQPSYNTVYQARVGRRSSVKLYEGVKDVVNADPTASTGQTGSIARFTGSVVPAKPGHIIYLQRLGDDGAYHTVEVGRIGFGSRYLLQHKLGLPGEKQFRVLVPGGPWNLRGVGPVQKVTVSP